MMIFIFLLFWWWFVLCFLYYKIFYVTNNKMTDNLLLRVIWYHIWSRSYKENSLRHETIMITRIKYTNDLSDALWFYRKWKMSEYVTLHIKMEHEGNSWNELPSHGTYVYYSMYSQSNIWFMVLINYIVVGKYIIYAVYNPFSASYNNIFNIQCLVVLWLYGDKLNCWMIDRTIK